MLIYTCSLESYYFCQISAENMTMILHIFVLEQVNWCNDSVGKHAVGEHCLVPERLGISLNQA